VSLNGLRQAQGPNKAVTLVSIMIRLFIISGETNSFIDSFLAGFGLFCIVDPEQYYFL
jgi:hypothetical protein